MLRHCFGVFCVYRWQCALMLFVICRSVCGSLCAMWALCTLAETLGESAYRGAGRVPGMLFSFHTQSGFRGLGRVHSTIYVCGSIH